MCYEVTAPEQRFDDNLKSSYFIFIFAFSCIYSILKSWHWANTWNMCKFPIVDLEFYKIQNNLPKPKKRNAIDNFFWIVFLFE